MSERIRFRLHWSLEQGAWADIDSASVGPTDLHRLATLRERLEWEIPFHHLESLTKAADPHLTDVGLTRQSADRMVAPYIPVGEFAQYRHRRVWLPPGAGGVGTPYVALGLDDHDDHSMESGRLMWRFGRVGFRLPVRGRTLPDTTPLTDLAHHTRIHLLTDADEHNVEAALTGDPALTDAIAREGIVRAHTALTAAAQRRDAVPFTRFARINRSTPHNHYRSFAADIPGPDGKPLAVAAIVEPCTYLDRDWRQDNAWEEPDLLAEVQQAGLHLITPRYLPDGIDGAWTGRRARFAYIVRNRDLFDNDDALTWLGEQGNLIAQGYHRQYRRG